MSTIYDHIWKSARKQESSSALARNHDQMIQNRQNISKNEIFSKTGQVSPSSLEKRAENQDPKYIEEIQWLENFLAKYADHLSSEITRNENYNPQDFLIHPTKFS